MAKLETSKDGSKYGKLLIDGKTVICGFESFSGWYWFATEISEIRKVGDERGGSIINGKEVNDTIYFGYIQGQDEEWGYFSLATIKSLGNRAWKIRSCDLPYSGRRDRS